MANRILKYPLQFTPGIVQHYPGDQFLAAGLDGKSAPSVWTVVHGADTLPASGLENFLRVVVLATGDDMSVIPDGDFAGHLGTFADENGIVWHVFALPSENYVAEARKAHEAMSAQLAAMGGRVEYVGEATTNEA